MNQNFKTGFKIFLELMPKIKAPLPQFENFYTRRYIDSDLELLHQLRTNPQVQEYHPDKIFTLQKTQEYFSTLKSHFDKYQFSYQPIFEKNSHDFLGICGLMFFDAAKENFDEGDVELGYALLPQYWKKGIATKLAQGFVNWGFENLPLKRIIAVCNPENSGSINVVKKLGGVYSKTVVNPRVGDTVDLYEILQKIDAN